jgi:hypothetical protein
MHWFGVKAVTVWLSFLLICILAGLAEVFDLLRSIEHKLDAMNSDLRSGDSRAARS